MTLDEMITNARDIACDNDVCVDSCKYSFFNCNICQEEHKQLSEWLEELKEYHSIGTPDELRGCAHKILEAYNKAIDDFKKEIKDAIDIGLEKVSPLSDVGSNLCTFYAIVDEIAEQLKGGDGE